MWINAATTARASSLPCDTWNGQEGTNTMALILLSMIIMTKFSTWVTSIDNRSPPWYARLPVPVKNAGHFLLRPFPSISMQLGWNGPIPMGAMTRLCRVKQFMGSPGFTFPVGPASAIVCAGRAVFPTSELTPIGPTLSDWALILLQSSAFFQLAGRV